MKCLTLPPAPSTAFLPPPRPPPSRPRSTHAISRYLSTLLSINFLFLSLSICLCVSFPIPSSFSLSLSSYLHLSLLFNIFHYNFHSNITVFTGSGICNLVLFYLFTYLFICICKFIHLHYPSKPACLGERIQISLIIVFLLPHQGRVSLARTNTTASETPASV